MFRTLLTRPYPVLYGIFLVLSGAMLSLNSMAAGLLTPSDGSLPALEIRDHKVNVVIEDGYAITTVDQVFHNPHGRDLEAHYSFPVPEHGSVSEFTMWIDGKAVTGEVLEKNKAKQVYEEEKNAGRDAGLTEKDQYKTFEVLVSPVRAGKQTHIRLAYIQPAHMDTGIGRYVYPLEEGGVDEEKLAFWTANDKVTGQFSFELLLRPAYPVEAIRVPGQSQASVKQLANGEWKVDLHSQGSSKIDLEEQATSATAQNLAQNTQPIAAAHTLNKDLVVYWRHKQGLPGSVDLIAHKTAADKRGTFMLVVTPGDDLQPITEGTDWLFVLDISGSMRSKYATLADGVRRSLKKMRVNDRFRIILFNNHARELTSGFINATPENIEHYIQEVSQIQPGGSTNLYAGLSKGLDELHADRTSAILLVTDGVANVGATQQKAFLELVKKKDLRLFTFIMGNSANRPMLEAITKASNGFAMSVSNSDDIVGQILNVSSKVTHQALHNVKLDISGIRTADLQPKIIGSLYRGQQLVLFGHYWGEGMANVKLSGKISGTSKSYETSFAFPATRSDNPEIERLWAYAAIEAMTNEINNFGENADLRQGIVDLGVEYGLVTDYTSMVIMQEAQFSARGIERKNMQRLKTESAAQKRRASRPATNHRVDQSQPMYGNGKSRSRPHFGGGGGAVDPWTLLLLVGSLMVVIARRKSSHLSF